MRTAARRFPPLIMILAFAFSAPVGAQTPRPTPGVEDAAAYTPKGPIEAKYLADGPWRVAKTRSARPCDRKGNRCTVYHPAKLGSNPLRGMASGFAHPVIAWANGTGVPTETYSLILRHWASWGLVVVASDDGSTALGESTEDAANYLLTQSRTPSSPFYGSCYTQFDDFGSGNALKMSYSRDGGLTWTASKVPRVGVIGGHRLLALKPLI